MQNSGDVAQAAQCNVNEEVSGAETATNSYSQEWQEDSKDDKKDVSTAVTRHWVLLWWLLVETVVAMRETCEATRSQITLPRPVRDVMR